MPNYVVNKNPQSGSKDHEVHDVASVYGCLPDVASRLDLGWHSDCQGAVSAAKAYFTDVDGCYYCARACHTG